MFPSLFWHTRPHFHLQQGLAPSFLLVPTGYKLAQSSCSQTNIWLLISCGSGPYHPYPVRLHTSPVGKETEKIPIISLSSTSNLPVSQFILSETAPSIWQQMMQVYSAVRHMGVSVTWPPIRLRAGSRHHAAAWVPPHFPRVRRDEVSVSLQGRTFSLALFKHRPKVKVSFSCPSHLLHSLLRMLGTSTLQLSRLCTDLSSSLPELPPPLN